LAPFWSARLGRDDLTGLQASARSGLVRTALRGERTLLTGTAVTVIDGELLTAF
ncbi:oxidoreductase, partial [Streptomyces sp. SID7982]|nr:oxidoreductase [Streptomyces sp. SID7982]